MGKISALLYKIFNDIIPFDTLKSSSVTLTTGNTAYLLPENELSGRKLLVVYNSTGHDIYFGGSDVTTSNGLLRADEKYFIIGASAGVYCVCATGSVSVRVLECK